MKSRFGPSSDSVKDTCVGRQPAREHRGVRMFNGVGGLWGQDRTGKGKMSFYFTRGDYKIGLSRILFKSKFKFSLRTLVNLLVANLSLNLCLVKVPSWRKVQIQNKKFQDKMMVIKHKKPSPALSCDKVKLESGGDTQNFQMQSQLMSYNVPLLYTLRLLYMHSKLPLLLLTTSKTA